VARQKKEWLGKARQVRAGLAIAGEGRAWQVKARESNAK
jgi:hypothetical protein